jgi:hypothetical protein
MAIIFPNNTLSEIGSGYITYPGNIVQIVENRITATLSHQNWSTQNELGTASITPKSASNKILVYINLTFRQDATQGTWSLGMFWLHNTTRNVNLITSGWNGGWRHVIDNYSKSYLDSPGSTTTQTYSLRSGNYPSNANLLCNQGCAHDGYSFIRLTEYAE